MLLKIREITQYIRTNWEYIYEIIILLPMTINNHKISKFDRVYAPELSSGGVIAHFSPRFLSP